MKRNVNLLWRYMKDYFSVYLPKQRNASPHTITACRDTWNLLLRYLKREKGMELQKLQISDISSSIVLGFLDFMERDKGWKASTRNQRLSCIRSFFHYASCMEPSLYAYEADLGKNLLKKAENKSHVIEFMEQDVMRELLATPDTGQKQGLRDQFFMSLMYDTAARDCEMLRLKLKDFNAENHTVYLMGKGSKPRLVPVSKETTALFQNYRKKFHLGSTGSEPLFYTIHQHEKTSMSDDNVARFLKKYARKAKLKNPDVPDNVHPHMFRKSRSMHLYRSGMPLALLAEFLGHEDPETTLIYAYADTEMKRKAIEKATLKEAALPENAEWAIWEGDDDIISRLCNGY